MYGTIVGDICGSVYERASFSEDGLRLFYDRKDVKLFTEGCRFTDDTALTIATAVAIMTDRDYARAYRSFYKGLPNRGYGSGFSKWADSKTTGTPYNSFGNGSAMRVSPVAWFGKS